MTTFSRALIEVTIAAPADEVWKSLRNPERVAQWFGWEYDSLAGEIEHIFFSHATADDDKKILAFGLGDQIEVEPKGDGCVLRIVRPAPTADHDWDDIFEDMTQGWIAFLLQLWFAVEHHAKDKRRTLFLSGSPLAANGKLARAALGLPATGAVGSAYAVTAPMGDALAGKIWHRGKHQLAVTVDGFGDGLVIAMDRAPDDKYPNGHSQLIITTYGLSDQKYAELVARWGTWWTERFDGKMPGC